MPLVLLCLTLSTLLLGACVPRGTEAGRVDEALRRLGPADRAGQLVVASVSPETSNIDSLIAWAAAAPAFPGGIWIEGGEGAAIERLTAVVRSRSGIPNLIGADLDEGVGHLSSGATPFPPTWRTLLTADDEQLELLGVVLAEEARALGIDIGYLRGPPTMGGPEFSHVDPLRLPERVDLLLNSARGAGLPLALGLFWSPRPTPEPVSWDLARLMSIELRVLNGAGGAVALVPGDMALPSLGGDTVPLPLSAAAYRVLRREHGWEAPIIADLRQVDARIPEHAVRAISAGADMVIVSSGAELVIRAIEAAVGDESLPAARFEAAARRVLELKLGGLPAEFPRQNEPPRPRQVSPADASNLARELASGLEPPPTEAPSAGQDDSTTRFTLEVVDPDQVGMSEIVLAEVDDAMDQAIADSVFTSAAVAIGRRGGLVRFRGYHAEGSEARPVDPTRTLFDIASLTKVVATTAATALLLDSGDLQLAAPVQRYVPEFRGDDKAGVTIGHLLTHTSGLPPGLWLYGSASSRDEALRQVFRQSLRRPPGEDSEYSDLGMILLAEVVERAAGAPIDQFLASRLFTPLDMSSTMFLPPLHLWERVVPTAVETERPFVLKGVVHDGNAFRLGGVTGHAGLFTTARDLAIYAQMMLNRGSYGGAQILSPELVTQLTARQEGADERALGWDTPADRSSAGRFFSAASYGHTGYTGTSIWIDPQRDLFVVLLTNRTYTEASSRDVLDLRIDVHEAAARAITDEEINRRPGAR